MPSGVFEPSLDSRKDRSLGPFPIARGSTYTPFLVLGVVAGVVSCGMIPTPTDSGAVFTAGEAVGNGWGGCEGAEITTEVPEVHVPVQHR